MIRFVIGILLLLIATLFLCGVVGYIPDTMLTGVIKNSACLMMSLIAGIMGIFNILDRSNS